MDSNDSPSPLLLFQTLTAYQRSNALKAGIDLGLFTAIGSHASTAAELASRLGAAERGMRILCDYLTIAGFLAKEGNSYRLTRDSAVFLDRNSPAYAGGAAEFLLSDMLVGSFATLAQAVRKGGTAQPASGSTAPEHPMWLAFARGMGAMMGPPADTVAELLALPNDQPVKILDISASHGLWGIAAARRNPAAQLVALDWAPVLELTRENARAAGLQDRFQTIAGSAFEVKFGSDYDAVLVPNFLHHFDLPTCVTFLRKVHTALRPGGRVAIVEFVPNEDRVTPPEAASFSLVMLATTAAGDAYTMAEYKRMLTGIGFGSISSHPLPPGNATAIIARK